MKNIIIDTNIVLDFLFARDESKFSNILIEEIFNKNINAWISAHSVTTIYYFLRRSKEEEECREILSELLQSFSILPTRKMSFNFQSKVTDFEDSVIEEGALQFHLEAIVTNNKKDFKNSKVVVYTPEEVLNNYFNQPEIKSVSFLDLKAQLKDVYNDIDDKITGIISNTSFVMGKPVNDFESEFAKAHNAKYCYGVGTGTAGNHMVLWALGIGNSDEVIIPANTFIATAWGATLCGAKPVFVDCHPESYNIDPDKIATLINEKTKAIVAVHLYGQPADMDGIKQALSSVNFEEEKIGIFRNLKTGQIIYLVEDCAQAHLSEYKGKKVGTLGIASSWSFYPGKNLGAYGEGGAVMTNDDDLAKKFKMIRDHGGEQKYVHQILGHNYRMEAIQGAVLGVKLKHLADWTEGRRRAASKYYELLNNVNGIKLPKELDYSKHVYHLFVAQVISQKSEFRTQKRDELQKFLNENGISTGLHYPIPLHLQPCFSNLGYKKGDFPVSEALAEQGLSLPMYAELNNYQIEFICDRVISFFK